MHPQRRTRSVRFHRGETHAAVGVVLLTALEAVAYICAPASAHAFVGGALLGAGSAAAIACRLVGVPLTPTTTRPEWDMVNSLLLR